MPARRMYLLDLGSLSGDKGWFLPGALGGAATRENRTPSRTWMEVPVPAALIEHEDGIVLFDAGTVPDALISRPRPTQNFPLTRFTSENRLEKQLSSIGFKPDDINYVVISHLHWDHIGQLPALGMNSKVPLIVQKKELEWALLTIWQGKGVYYTAEDMNPLLGANWFPLQEKAFELLDGIVLEWTGGHTPGHQIAKVTLNSGDSYVLTGDYLHIPEEYDLETKGWLLGDGEEWQTEIRKLKLEVLSRKSKLVISHDPGLWEKYPKAPKALE
jgi:N-acyl homoserine lactone hydrolase